MQFDIKQAIALLTAYDESLVTTIQVYDDSGKTNRANHYTLDLKIKKIQDFLIELNRSGLGIYFMVNEGDGRGRDSVNVTRIRALIADLDGSPLEPVLSCKLEPHFIVESSPGRYQCHWLIEPIAVSDFESLDAARNYFASLQVAINRKFGGDTSVKDLPRVMRLPGFYHQKREPFLSRIIESSLGQPYSVNTVIESLELSTIIEQVKTTTKESLSEVDTLLGGKVKVSTRHATLLAYASKYAHNYRLGYNERRWILEGLNKEACESPIPQKDLDRINVQAGKYAEDERAKVSDIDFSELIEKYKIQEIKQKADLFPLDLLQPKGLVGDMFAYILASSIKPQPELALAASFVACGTVMGRKVRTLTNARTNIYCIGLAETGGGKDWPRQAIKRVFEAIGKSNRACVEEAASDAAISEILYQTPSQCFLFDEFGRLLKNVNSKMAGTHLTSIPTLLMKLFSSANGPFFTKSYADVKQNKVIHQPNVTMFATTVETNFYKALSRESVDDGLLNRILFFRSTDPDPQMRDIENFDPPQDLLDKFLAWESLPIRQEGNLQDLDNSGIKPQPRTVGYAEGAKDIFRDMESDLRVYRAELRKDGLSGLFTRVYENAHKIALIYSCGQNIECPQIEVSDAIYACNLVLYLTKSLYAEITNKVSDNKVEANHKAIIEIIKSGGSDGISRKHFGWKCKDRGLHKRERDDILKELMEWGMVITKEVATQTRPVTKYFFVPESEKTD